MMPAILKAVNIRKLTNQSYFVTLGFPSLNTLRRGDFRRLRKMASKALAKPQMRGLLQSQIKKHLIVAGVLAISGGAIYKFTVAEPRKAKYAEFYKNYDAEKEFERMRKLGVFDSAPAD